MWKDVEEYLHTPRKFLLPDFNIQDIFLCGKLSYRHQAMGRLIRSLNPQGSTGKLALLALTLTLTVCHVSFIWWCLFFLRSTPNEIG